jgi:uncharacterized Tic20 family protein
MMPMIEQMQPSHAMNLVIFLTVLVGVLIIWNFQRDKNNQVDIKDLICVDGRINSNKFMRFTAFVVSTWGFIYLIVDQRFSEWYFAGYMATWTGSALLSKWIDSKNGSDSNSTPPPPNK